MSKEPPDYSRRSLARLALSVSAAQLADRLTNLVCTGSDAWSRPGELADNARALVQAAEELLAKAVTCERVRGTSWADLGATLDVSRQAAQQKYGTDVDDWVAALARTVELADGHLRATLLPEEGAETPSQHAQRLDAWAKRHTGKPQGKALVSAGLERAGFAERIRDLTSYARRVSTQEDAVKLRGYLRAKAALLAEMAAEDPTDSKAAETAESARRELEAISMPNRPSLAVARKPNQSAN
jgi:hypothetical protein